MPYGHVYLVTNKINGKVYVGQTVQTMAKRWNGQVSGGAGSILKNAIKKYGKEEFCTETLVYADNQQQLDKDEDFYILLSGALNRKVGYNLKRGGANGRMSEESKAKLSRALLGLPKSESHKQKLRLIKLGNQNWLGKTHTAETKAKQRAARLGKHCPHKGHSQTEETRQKLRDARTRHDISTDLLVWLYMSNIGTTTIGRLVGCSGSAVQWRLKKAGMVLRGK